MKKMWHKLSVITILCITQIPATIMRNDALMNTMVSHFQNYNSPRQPQKKYKEKEQTDFHNEPQRHDHASQKPEKVLSLMQNVLCRNFPKIPCEMITGDNKLKQLIEKSIQQIKYKSMNIEKTTITPEYHLTMFPTINSEDLSNFLQVHQNFYGKRKMNQETHSRKQKDWSHEKIYQKSQKMNELKRKVSYNGRKKLRKFYPHKIKYKDKNAKNSKDLRELSEEKLSMSVEDPDMPLNKRHQHLRYKVEPENPAVWRIDYTKHGEPSLNIKGFEDERLKGKHIKTGPNVIVDENVLEQNARKDVLHPDVYIKKNFMRQNVMEINSEGME